MAKSYKVVFEASYTSNTIDDYSVAKGWLWGRSFGPYISEHDELLGGGNSHPIISPWTGDHLATVRPTELEDIDLAVMTAIRAHDIVEKLRANDIYTCMHKIAASLEKNRSLLAEIDSLSRGVPMSTPREFDIPAMIQHFKYYANVVYKIPEEPDTVVYDSFVVCVITKDTPLIALAWLLAPAFASKVSVCLVVPMETVLPAFFLAEMCIKGTDFDGMLNILPGNEDTVMTVVSNCNVTNVMYFGPTTMGQIIKKTIPCEAVLSAALMTGHSQMLVFDTADLAAVVDCIVKSVGQCQGIVPWAVKKLIVQESVFEQFSKMLKCQLSKMCSGPDLKKKDVDPVKKAQIHSGISEMIKKAEESGIEVFQVELPEDLSRKLYFPPTLLIGGDVERDSMIYEVMGLPIVSLVPFRVAKEAVAMANNARGCLAASIWLESQSLSLSVADSLRVGTVWINGHGIFDAAVPFGGLKICGLGSFGGFDALPHTFLSAELNSEREVMLPLKPAGDPGREYQLYYSGADHCATGNRITVFIKGGIPFASIAQATSDDVLLAVESAMAAQQRWAATRPAVKSNTLHNMAGHLHAHRDHLESVCQPDDFLAGIVSFGIRELSSWGYSAATDISSCVGACAGSHVVRVSKEPLGVVAISPLENDLVSLLAVVPAAIALGNAVLLVLEADSSLPTIDVFKAMLEGAPPGLVNIVTGDPALIMASLATNPAVDCIWFPDCPTELASLIEYNSAEDMKRTVVHCHSCLSHTVYEQKLSQVKAVWMSNGTGLC